MSNFDNNDDYDMRLNKASKHTVKIVKENPYSLITNSMILDDSTDNDSNNDCNDVKPYNQGKS
eukprot:1597942-Ditylum_brightwellii.AAC.1